MTKAVKRPSFWEQPVTMDSCEQRLTDRVSMWWWSSSLSPQMLKFKGLFEIWETYICNKWNVLFYALKVVFKEILLKCYSKRWYKLKRKFDRVTKTCRFIYCWQIQSELVWEVKDILVDIHSINSFWLLTFERISQKATLYPILGSLDGASMVETAPSCLEPSVLLKFPMVIQFHQRYQSSVK